MTLIRIDGFEDNLDDVKWPIADRSSSATSTGLFGRRGGRGLRHSGSSTIHWSTKLSPTEEHALLCCGFAVRLSSLTYGVDVFQLCSDNNTVVHVAVEVGLSGVWLKNGLGSVIDTVPMTIATSTWYYVEFYAFLADAGYGRLGVNGVYRPQVNADTRNGGTKTVFDSVRLRRSFPGTSFTLNVDIDDVYVRRNSTSFLGDVEINTYFPTAQGGSAQYLPSDGVGPNYTLVDEAVPSATDYVYSNTVGHKDSYKFTGVPATRLVHGVAARSYAKKATDTSADARPFVRLGGVDTPGDAMALTTAPDVRTHFLEKRPDGSAWTGQNVLDAEFGIETV